MCLLLNYVSQIQSYWREGVNAAVSSTLIPKKGINEATYKDEVGLVVLT